MEKELNEDDDQQDTKRPALNPQSTQQQQQQEEEQQEEEQRVERRRRMNMIHSRRKRQRRKIEVEVLKEQVGLLTANNVRLRSENQQLEALLVQVQQMVGTPNSHQMLSQGGASGVQPLVMSQPAAVAATALPQQQPMVTNTLQSNQLALQQILQYQLLSSLFAQVGSQPGLLLQPFALPPTFPEALQQLPTGQLPLTTPTIPAVATTATGPMDSNSVLQPSMVPTQVVGSFLQPMPRVQMKQQQEGDVLASKEGGVQQEEPKKCGDDHEQDNNSDRDFK